MLIDWFTVVAQIVNFVVLVALLRRFLWGPLVHAIDEREKRVAGSLSSAEGTKKEAEQQMENVRAKTVELEQQRDQIIAQAKRDADALKNEITREAHESVRQQELKWHADLEQERANFLSAVRSRTAAEILKIVRQALADLASSDVERCAVEAFLEKLRTLDVAALGGLPEGEVAVRSAQEIPEETRAKIEKVLHERLGATVRLRFERAAEMPWGIELRGDGQRIGWTPDSYVDSLEKNLNDVLERSAEAHAERS